MPKPKQSPDPLRLRELALSRWDNEGGLTPPTPYKSTPVFDEVTLPQGLRGEHRTKPGVWGVIRVLEGRLRYVVLSPPAETVLDPSHSGLVLPDQPHFVEPLGPVRLKVEFYRRHPRGA